MKPPSLQEWLMNCSEFRNNETGVMKENNLNEMNDAREN